MIKKIVKLAAQHELSCSKYHAHVLDQYRHGTASGKQLAYAQGKEDSATEFGIDLARHFMNHRSPVDLISSWSRSRNIIDGSSPKDQCMKLVQEVGELSDNLCKGNNPIDDIGDCIVCLNNIALQHNLTLEECILKAYEDIKDRKGVMRDGVFIKEADL